MKSGMVMIWIKISFVLIVLFLIFFVYAFIEKYLLVNKTYKIKVNKKAFNGYKIIFLTDFHYSEFVSLKLIRKVVKQVNDLEADLILLGGDYVTSRIGQIDPVFNELKHLKAKDGIYGVIGNHDYDTSKSLVLEAMGNSGIISLDNKAYWIDKNGERIRIGGVADNLFDKPDINPTINNTLPDDFIIVVSHNPDYVEKIKSEKIDLMLSGHTHGGQVTVFGLYAPYIPAKQKYRTGLKIVNRISLIISNGIGVVGLPIRFFARPQVVIIELGADSD
jgi:hypothetical protein